MKIHHKLTYFFGIIIAINLLWLYFYLQKNFKEDTYQQIEQLLYKQTLLSQAYIEKTLATSSSSPDWDAVADLIGNALDLRVTIIGWNGAVWGDSTLPAEAVKKMENHANRPEIQNAMKLGTGDAVRYSSTKNLDMVYHAVPFGQGPYKGIVRLALARKAVELNSNRLKGILAVSLIFAFGVSILLSYIATALFSKPILEIAKVADKIARGDFSEKIHLPRRDAIGNLAQSLNKMSDQVRARIEEVALGRSRLEAVLLSMFEGVLVVDRQENILLMNQSLTDLLKIEGEPIGKKALECVRNLSVQNLITKAMELRSGVLSEEINLLLPAEKIVLVHATPVIFEGKSEGVVLIFHDITELRRLEKIRQEFVANVSHELRTPIASIKGYAETLLEGALDDKENARDFIGIIHTDSERLARLIEDILNLSRIEADKIGMHFQPCDLYGIVERTAAGFSKSMTEKKLSFQNKIPRQLPKVYADEDRLAQVFLNLIDNAIKYNSKGGKIIISAEEKNGFVEVRVQDTGLGIPSEDQPRIFERFYRVDKARSRELGGTGLGLAIVKHIIQAHKGEVSVQSQVGQGSIFIFTIPQTA